MMPVDFFYLLGRVIAACEIDTQAVLYGATGLIVVVGALLYVCSKTVRA